MNRENEISIGDKKIGPGHPPFIIAEMSGNHNQSLDRALAIVETAAKAGAHAVKLQTYTADTMTFDIAEREFFIKDQDSLWKGRSLYELYKEAHTPWAWHKPIFDRCRELGVIYLSTPFDETAVDFLEELDVPCYKVASFENTDIQLIRKVAATGKPMIISTGLVTIAELDETVRTARKAGCRDLILLKCTSSYPAKPTESNLRTIPHMKKLFTCQVGLSDHTLGIGVAIAAVACGANLIEKHFTLCRADGGVDSKFSLEPHELKELVTESKRAWQAMGKVVYGPTVNEKKSLVFKRSLYISQDMKKGDIFNENNLRRIRPGYGLPICYYDLVFGRSATCDISRGTPLSWDFVGQ